MSYGYAYAIPALSLPSLLLASGTATTSYVLFSNLGDTQRGIMPLLNDRLGKLDPELTTGQRVRLWNLYWPKAMFQIVGTSVVSAALNFTASYLHPSPLISRLTLVSGVGSLLILAITPALGLLSLNSQLMQLDKGKDSDGSKVDQAHARELIKSWEKKHFVRYIAYVTAWASSFAALVLEARV